MCDNYGLPLALIFEEILADKPPKETEEEQEEERTGGTAQPLPPLFCYRRRQAACKGRQAAFAALVVWGITQGLETLLGASMGLVGRSMLSAAEQGHRRQQLPPPPIFSRSRSLGPTSPPPAARRPAPAPPPPSKASKEGGGSLCSPPPIVACQSPACSSARAFAISSAKEVVSFLLGRIAG